MEWTLLPPCRQGTRRRGNLRGSRRSRPCEGRNLQTGGGGVRGVRRTRVPGGGHTRRRRRRRAGAGSPPDTRVVSPSHRPPHFRFVFFFFCSFLCLFAALEFICRSLIESFKGSSTERGNATRASVGSHSHPSVVRSLKTTWRTTTCSTTSERRRLERARVSARA